MSLRPFIKTVVAMLMILALVLPAFAQEHGEKPADGTAHVVKAEPYNKAFAVGMAAFGVAIGVGLVGFAATSGVSRNPGASGEILKFAILSMAFVEAIIFYALYLL